MKISGGSSPPDPEKTYFIVSVFLGFLKMESEILSALKKLTIHIFPKAIIPWDLEGIAFLDC